MPLTEAERAIVEGHLGIRPRTPEPAPPAADGELPAGWVRIPGLPEPVLNAAAAAAHLGIKQASIHRYRVAAHRAREAGEDPTPHFPDPDFEYGRTQGWFPSTLTRWRASQPGRGFGGGRPRKDPEAVQP